MVTFSIIIATRNRPALFRRALESVCEQSNTDIDIIVVDDGSSEDNAALYRSMVAKAPRPVQHLTLPSRTTGHGPAYTRNFGASFARGEYLSFLDDDDSWTDPSYLLNASRTIAGCECEVDLYLSNQLAFRRGVQLPQPIWIEDLVNGGSLAHRDPDSHGAYKISADEVLSTDRFCHMNTSIVRRSLFMDIGGFDESIRWEEDRDLYWRLVARAKTIFYFPGFVARHNAPDSEPGQNASTALGERERRLHQMRVFDKAALFSDHPTIRGYGRRHKVYSLKRMAAASAERKDYKAASFYALQAWGASPKPKWTAYTLFLLLNSWLRG